MNDAQHQALKLLVAAGELTRAIDAMQEQLVQASAKVDIEVMGHCAMIFEHLRSSRHSLAASFDIAEAIRAHKPVDERKEENE